MYSAPLVVDDLESDHDYNGVRTYARTKRMQVVLADAWAHRMAGTDVKSRACTLAGWTPRGGGVPAEVPGHHPAPAAGVADGADTVVWLVATRPESKPGHFWHDRAAADHLRLAAQAEPSHGPPVPAAGHRSHRDVKAWTWTQLSGSG